MKTLWPNKRLEPTRLVVCVHSYAGGRAAQAQRSTVWEHSATVAVE